MNKSDNIFRVKKADDSSGLLLWRVTTLWQRGIVKSLEQYGLTHSQFVLMASIHWLTLHEEEVTQIALSSHTRIDPMTTSTVLRTLQKKGFIERIVHPKDSRAKIVYLTEKGKKIAKEAVKIVENYDEDFFSVLKSNRTDFNNQLNTLIQENSNDA
jgi:DNA-binding MarR family transcriptional regulator